MNNFELYYTYDDSLLNNEAFKDCACPSLTPLLDSTALHPHAIMHRHAHQQDIPLSHDYQVMFTPSLSRVVVLNGAAAHLLQRFDEPQPLTSLSADEQATIQQFYRLGLLYAHDSPPQLRLSEPDALVAWLHITNQCNLRCSYCYIRPGSEMMTSETAYAAVDAVLRSARLHGYRQIHLKYAGGEPTLDLPLVEQTHRYAQQQASRSGIALHGAILSNGADLSDDRLQRIRDLGLRLMISLDGLQPFHDAQRPLRSGQGSFAAVTASIERAREQALDLTISVTITSTNVVGLPAVVAWLLEREIHFTLNFYRTHDNQSGSGDSEWLHLDEQRVIAGMRAAYRVIEQRLPRYSLLGSLLDRVNLAVTHRHTCPVGHHYLVIDPQGSVAKCQMDIAHPVTSVWDEDPLGTIRSDHSGLQNLAVEQKEVCRDCQWRYWCTGGCALLTHYNTGRYDTRSPNCAIYQALSSDIIRLEGLRLLHNAPG